jgi:asparagine synthase (glutamine-hydrolysing)
MCGIAGILGKNVSNKQILLQMLQKQRHRGPDALVQWNQDDVFLGHNRLSILDLSEAANQPMTSACGRYTIVFNGEIYNYLELKKNLHYSFKTNSDTEVLLAMYVTFGKEMLHDLNGMFSFAIWDESEKILFAARDRFGVKPFYYAFSGGQFYFASEIKTLLQAGINSTKNETVWADYFVHGSYGLPNETFYENIAQLPGGHLLTIHGGETKPTIARYYDFVAGIRHQQVYGTEEDLKSAYTALLYDSISLRFRSDVPVGFNVSGGLDSSILLALISDVKHDETEKIEAFTFYTGDSRYDELPWVEQLMAKTKNPLNAVQLHVEDVPELIHQIACFQDEPYGGFPTIAYSLLFKEARAKGIKVLLDGQGMDEAWAGYDTTKRTHKPWYKV